MKPTWRNLASAAALALLVIIVYRPAFSAGWIWDDDGYIYANNNLLTAQGLERTWLDRTASPQYYPLTFTSFWIERHLFGPSPTSFHRDNVLLHAASAILIWIILRKLNVPAAWLIAVLWAVHPVNVESVAWASERKNVLSTFFYLLAALMYLPFALSKQAPHVHTGLPTHQKNEHERPILTSSFIVHRSSFFRYFLALAFFILALFSKTVTATFPAAMLLVAWWKRGIKRRDWLLVLPFFVVALPLSLNTGYLERTHVGARGPEFAWSKLERCEIAAHDAFFYAAKDILPVNLSFIYPKWDITYVDIVWVIALLAAIALLWLASRKWGRGVLVGPLFFLGTLLPALGFVNVYPMRFSFVADHFQYLASLGVVAAIIAALGHRHWFTRSPLGRIAACSIVTVFSVLTFHRAQIFQSSFSLWNDALAKNPDSWMVRTNTGVMLLQSGQSALGQHDIGSAEQYFSAAQLQLQAATSLRSDLAEPWLNLAQIEQVQGHFALAEQYIRRALGVDAHSAEVHFHLGAVLVKEGKVDDGIAEYYRAIAIDPRHLPAWVNLGVALDMQGKIEQSIAADRQAIIIDPDSLFAHTNLGNELLKHHQPALAAAEFRKALLLQPNFAPAEKGLREATQNQ
ncbi:MAG TPA: tetratricopeptide repeat protein [Tepidisphaeraceae bacterium]|jgi:Tfp pilus assembly protein PilF